MLDLERKIQLITEAQVLSEKINRARFEERIPYDDYTIRLCEIIDILADDIHAVNGSDWRDKVPQNPTAQIKKALGKKRMALVSEIVSDGFSVNILLKDGSSDVWDICYDYTVAEVIEYAKDFIDFGEVE
jgi:hypothetical protein